MLLRPSRIFARGVSNLLSRRRRKKIRSAKKANIHKRLEQRSKSDSMDLMKRKKMKHDHTLNMSICKYQGAFQEILALK